MANGTFFCLRLAQIWEIILTVQHHVDGMIHKYCLRMCCCVFDAMFHLFQGTDSWHCFLIHNSWGGGTPHDQQITHKDQGAIVNLVSTHHWPSVIEVHQGGLDLASPPIPILKLTDVDKPRFQDNRQSSRQWATWYMGWWGVAPREGNKGTEGWFGSLWLTLHSKSVAADHAMAKNYGTNNEDVSQRLGACKWGDLTTGTVMKDIEIPL